MAIKSSAIIPTVFPQLTQPCKQQAVCLLVLANGAILVAFIGYTRLEVVVEVLHTHQPQYLRLAGFSPSWHNMDVYPFRSSARD